MNHVIAHRVTAVALGLVMAAFLTSAVVSAAQGETVSPVMLWLAGTLMATGLIHAMARSMRFAGVADDLKPKGKGLAPVVLFVLFGGFIGSVGLEQTLLAAKPTVSVTAEVSSCSKSRSSGMGCYSTYKVDGREHKERVPVWLGVPSGTKLEIDVLRSDPSVVTTRSWMDILIFRVAAIALFGGALFFGVRWFREARKASVEWKLRFPDEVHSNGSNPSVK